jgi:hypothetical protein
MSGAVDGWMGGEKSSKVESYTGKEGKAEVGRSPSVSHSEERSTGGEQATDAVLSQDRKAEDGRSSTVSHSEERGTGGGQTSDAVHSATKWNKTGAEEPSKAQPPSRTKPANDNYTEVPRSKQPQPKLEGCLGLGKVMIAEPSTRRGDQCARTPGRGKKLLLPPF